MTVPLLDVADLRVDFPSEEGRVSAVRGIDCTVASGEVLALVGESGSGKSVTAAAVLGLLPDHARVRGSIRLRGTELLSLGDRELSRLRGTTMSMVFQDPLSALTPVYRVGDQIAEALRVHGASRSDAAARAVQLLELVGIPDAADRARAFPHEFSGGMRQRVVIAIAIANNPDLIVCDEPTTALDVTSAAQILDLLRTARDLTGAGIVLITHDLGVAATLADRIAVMYAGRIVETAPATELLAAPAMPYTVGLLDSLPRLDAPPRTPLVPITGSPPAPHALPPGCPFAPRCPATDDACRSAEPALAEIATGRRAACVRPGSVAPHAASAAPPDPADAGPPEPILQVRKLVKSYPVRGGLLGRRRRGVVRAVDQVSLTVRAGRTTALVGESGSGKSSVLTAILDLTAPESGRIEIFGRDVADLDRAGRRAMRRRIQIVFQDPAASLDPRLPIFDSVAEPLRIARRPRAEIARRVPELIDQVGLQPEHADRYPVDFSGGQKQRINIARALASSPDLLVLDEPVSALDVSIQAGILNLLRRLQLERGLGYLFVSHDLAVVRNLAHHVAVMRAGRIVEDAPADELFADPRHPYTRSLLAAVPSAPPLRIG
ncbi:dipeptide ABC transporter ATP-binding protein [Skermania piniformis]|uniref:ABC transporter ATP-binding protein n=1 Tax=Skermania pinensis TaxID=39122 RepID=A0ABX8S845_9ACTN|nr:ABC transporter ATP-binding protein [Skermania piniformis]QXQ14034.1 ABC transporter ATP-binding protein [Skermania piniformis]